MPAPLPDHKRKPPTILRYLGPIVFGIGGTAVLVTLCVWQLQRLEWKQGLISRIEAQIAADPVPLPADPDREADEYLPVTVDGMIGEGEIHVLTSAKPGGPGYRVISPLETVDGRRILVDRGYVPETEKRGVRMRGYATVTGNLAWPNETDGFTPDPDLDRNIWFARNVQTLANALKTEPILIVAREPTGDPSPRPLPITVNLTNNHLQYAITWGTLAALWLAMTIALLIRVRRNTV